MFLFLTSSCGFFKASVDDLSSPSGTPNSPSGPTLPDLFLTKGYLQKNFMFGADSVPERMKIQTDGKILLGGWCDTDMGWDVCLARYNTDGSFDQNFGDQGRLQLPVSIDSHSSDELYDLAIQADGKIVGVGHSFNSGRDKMAIFRVNQDGTMDTSFGIDGLVLNDIGASSNAYGLAILPDGKLLVAGRYYTTFPDYDIALVRYNSDGSVDTSFASGGTAIFDFDDGDDVIRLAMGTSGEIYLYGMQKPATKINTIILKLNSNGTLDNGFGTAGKLTLSKSGTADDLARSFLIQDDGKILASTEVVEGANKFIGIYRLDSTTGVLDPSFGTSGSTFFSETGYSWYSSIIKLTTGKYLISGGYSTGRGDSEILRMNSDGSLDGTFGTAGYFQVDFSGSGKDDYITNMAVGIDGSIILSGMFADPDWNYTFGLAKINSDGVLQNSLGGVSSLLTKTGLKPDESYALEVLADGSVLVAGGVDFTSWIYDGVIVKHLPTGQLDSSFGIGGVAQIGDANFDEIFYTIKVQSDGKILAAGERDSDSLVVRLLADGTLDPSFGTGGIVVVPVSGGSTDKVSSMALDSFGGIYCLSNFNGDIGLFKLTNSGTLDSSFDTDGIFSFSPGAWDAGTGLIILSDGKLLLSGYSNQAGNKSILARVNSNGSLDVGYGVGGIKVHSLGTGASSFFNIIEQSAGEILLTGQMISGGQQVMNLVRVDTDGNLDPSFATGGIYSLPPDASFRYSGADITIDDQGRIYVATEIDNWDYSYLQLNRFDSNGSLDLTFGIAGFTYGILSGFHEFYPSTIRYYNGHLFLTGYTAFLTGSDFTVVRYSEDGVLGL